MNKNEQKEMIHQMPRWTQIMEEKLNEHGISVFDLMDVDFEKLEKMIGEEKEVITQINKENGVVAYFSEEQCKMIDSLIGKVAKNRTEVVRLLTIWKLVELDCFKKKQAR